MTQDEIIEMWQATSRKPNHIEEFARLVAAKEREALLQVVYGYASNLKWNEDFQADIEARGVA